MLLILTLSLFHFTQKTWKSVWRLNLFRLFVLCLYVSFLFFFITHSSQDKDLFVLLFHKNLFFHNKYFHDRRSQTIISAAYLTTQNLSHRQFLIAAKRGKKSTKPYNQKETEKKVCCQWQTVKSTIWQIETLENLQVIKTWQTSNLLTEITLEITRGKKKKKKL